MKHFNNLNNRLNRRDFIKKAGVFGLSTLSLPLISNNLFSSLQTSNVSMSKNSSISKAVAKTINNLGTMKKFVSRGDIVMIKPNIAFAHPYKMGSNTNPNVVKKVIELCLDAGAKKVRVFDRSADEQKEAYKLSGIEKICRQTGAELVYYKESRTKEVKINGIELKKWPVVIDCIECDKLINVPIAKDHYLTGLTLGMKNLFGAVGGSRWELHAGIEKCIVDLAKYFKPHLTIIDASRIMIKNGPRGGSFSDIKKIDTVLAGKDFVACDAYAATLFNTKPEKIKHIALAGKLKLVQSKLGKIKVLN